MKPTSKAIVVGRAAIAAFGGMASVHRYWDDRRKSHVEIVSCIDSPLIGVTSYATVGVHEKPLVKDGVRLDVRAELVGACYSSFDRFANCLATAAFYIKKAGWFVAPGIVFPDILSAYDMSNTMAHFLFLPPFLWDERLKTVDVGGQKVAWLLSVPISQNELNFAKLNGVPMLEKLLEEKQIDIFDLNRGSIV